MGHIGYTQISEYDFKSISIKDGLTQSTVLSIYQDGKGFIWFGTFDGLNRFDGRSIKAFLPYVKDDSIKSISHGTITGLDGDKHDKMFIATYGGGLNVLNLSNNKFKYYEKNDSLSIIDNYLNAILYVNDTTVWIATDKGVSRFNPEKETFHNYPFKHDSTDIMSRLNALSLFVDNDINLWVGTNGRGLLKLSQVDGSYKFYQNNVSSENLISRNYIRSIVEYEDGFMLLATKAGLFVFDPEVGNYELFNLLGKNLRDVIKDKNKNYWITTVSNGLIRIDKKGKITEFKHNDFDQQSFTDNSLFVSYCDNLENVWIGTISNGAVRINTKRKPFTNLYHVANQPSIPDNSIFDFSEDDKGRVWIGTENGLSLWNRKDNTFETIGLKIFGEYSYDNAIWNLSLDENNDLWIATSVGVVRYNVNSRSQQHYYNKDGDPGSLVNDDIYYIAKDQNSNVWIATSNGVSRFNTRTNTFVNYFADGTPNSISNSNVEQIYNDRKGRLWFCTADGLNLYNTESDDFKVYRFDEGTEILSNDIFFMFETKDDEFWLATSKGISIFDSEKGVIIKNIGVKDGMPNPFVYRMLESETTVWVSTNRGLAVIDKNTYKVKDVYYEEDGLQSNEFNPAAIKLNDGYFLFGGINGVTGFYPDSIHKSGFIPPIYFTGLSVFGEEITMSDTILSDKINFKKNIISASKISFYPKEKMFSLRFAALDYSNAERIKYYYRMLPVSPEWVSLGEHNFVTFVDLSPGDYNLEVKSTNGDGVLCDNVKSITIVVKPPFWKKKWVIFVEILLLLFIVIFVFKYRTYRLSKEKKKLEDIVKSRTHEIQLKSDEIARQKDKLEHFAAGLEEEVKKRTSELELAKQKAEESDKLKSAFLSNMSHEIRTPMNAILGFSELLSTPGFDESERLSFARMVRTNSDALLNLLNDIIDISMIESGQLKLSLSDVDIYNLINNVFILFESSTQLAEKKQVKLVINIDNNSDSVVKTDSQRLLQILNNLIGNAIKFTGKGFVEFGYIKEKNKLLFFVKDTGIGIDDKVIKKIFNRFYKLENVDKNLYRGNGLGLAITKNLVEALNGEIWVESEKGKGTKFYFTLPIE